MKVTFSCFQSLQGTFVNFYNPINKVQRMMNRAATIITGNFESGIVYMIYNVRGVELLRQLGLMNLKERRDFMNLLVLNR